MQIEDIIAPLRHAIAEEDGAEEALHPHIDGARGEGAPHADVLALVPDPTLLQGAPQVERHSECAEVVVGHPIDVAQPAKQAVAAAQLVTLEAGEAKQATQILDVQGDRLLAAGAPPSSIRLRLWRSQDQGLIMERW